MKSNASSELENGIRFPRRREASGRAVEPVAESYNLSLKMRVRIYSQDTRVFCSVIMWRVIYWLQLLNHGLWPLSLWHYREFLRQDKAKDK